MGAENKSSLWRPAALLAWGVAGGLLLRRHWGPLLEANLQMWLPSGGVAFAALVYAGISAALALVLWTLTQFVEHGLGYRGLDRPALVAIGLLTVDVIADLGLALSGAQGFALYPIPLGFTIIASYPQFLHLSLGTAFMAVGYSLLRLPPGAAAWLPQYARLQVATGALMAAPPLVRAWPIAAALTYGALGLLLWNAAESTSERR